MTKKNNSKKSIPEILGEHPIRALIGSFVTGFGISTAFWVIIDGNKIENLNNRQQDQIERLKFEYEQKLELNLLKLKTEQQEKYYQKVDPNTDIGIILLRAMENIENEK